MEAQIEETAIALGRESTDREYTQKTLLDNCTAAVFVVFLLPLPRRSVGSVVLGGLMRGLVGLADVYKVNS